MLGGQNSERSWILSFKLGSSGFQHSQMALFFQCFYLIADIFQVRHVPKNVIAIVQNSRVDDDDSLQSVLDEFCRWATQNDMKLNPDKCINMNVCFMKNPPETVPLKMCLKDLKQVDNVKILGVTISSDLKWDLHMSQVLRKASNKLYMLKVLKKFKLSTVDLLTIYRGYIRPLLEYAVPVWNAGITVCQSDQLERIQKRALRIILGPEYICYENALQQCNITTLKERRTSISLKFAKDLYNSGHFKDWLPIKVREKVQYSLRNSNNFINIRCRTDRYKNSAIPYFVKLLNE